MKFKLNDEVVVITGKDKGKKGKIIRLMKKQGKVVVEGVNMRIKHVKKTQQQAGEKITFEGSINASNVMLVCPHTGKRTRVGYEKTGDGKKMRISKKSGKSIDEKVASVKVKKESTEKKEEKSVKTQKAKKTTK